MKTITIGPLVITTTRQAAGAPFIDRATTVEKDGPRRWRSIAVLLQPWKRDRYGASLLQRALVLGWALPVCVSGHEPDRAAPGSTPVSAQSNGRPS